MVSKNNGLRVLTVFLAILIMFSLCNIGIKSANATTSADLSISQNGIDFIKGCEGFSEYCYYDGAQSSIGYGTKCGTTAHSSKQHKITREQAEIDMLREINNQYIPNIRKQTSGIQMNQSQFDALVSFTYNTGGGNTMIKNSPLVKFLRGELSESDARSQFENYVVTNSATGKVDQGLKNRRNKEANLFFSDVPHDSKVPTYSNLESDKTMIAVGEEITFTASSDYATGFTIGIYEGTEQYSVQAMPDGRLTLTFDKAGEYGAYVTSYNSLGYVDSNWVGFIVYDSAPTYSNLEANKKKIAIGEEITFTALSDFASEYWIGIDNEDSRYITNEMPNGQLTLSFDKTGSYSAYVTSSNSLGGQDSKLIYFTVYDPNILNGDLNADGEFNISDAVLLQKWLLSAPDAELVNWKAADLCKDDKLDIFDMIEMRKLLIQNNSLSAQ